MIDKANTGFSGATTVSSNTLTLKNALALGTSSITNNANLILDFNGMFVGSLGGGTGSLTTKGDIVLDKASTGFSGSTTIASDTLTIQNKDAVGSSTVNLSGNALKLKFDGIFGGSFSGSGELTTNGDVVLDKASADFTGSTVVEGGTLALTHKDALGWPVIDNKNELIFDFEGDFGNTVTNNGTMVTGTDVNMTGDQSTYTGTVDITKKTVTLGSEGGTDFESGATYDVKDTGFLRGAGTIGSLIVYDGGTLSPGFSPGVITASNGAKFESGGTFEYEIDLSDPNQQHDLLVVTAGDVEIEERAQLEVVLLNNSNW